MGDGHNTGVTFCHNTGIILGGRDQILVTINLLGHPIFVQAWLPMLFIFSSISFSTHHTRRIELPLAGKKPKVTSKIGSRSKPISLLP